MRVYLLLFLTLSLSAFAQITITSNDVPALNDKLLFANASPTAGSFDFTLTSGNHVWDFSTLVPTSYDTAKYVASSGTPYAFYSGFFGKYGTKISNSIGFGTFTFTNIYDFYGKTSSVYKAEGYGFTYSSFPLAALYSDDDEIYQFPLNYNDIDNSTFRLTATIPTIGSYLRKGTRVNEVDGWGQITTPQGTFSCLRVKSTIAEIDSIYTTLGNFGFPINTIEYKWLTNGEHFPVLEVTGTSTSGFTPNRVRYRYTQPASSIQSQLITTQLGMYPNPVQQEIHFAQQYTILPKTQLSLFNMEGREILKTSVNTSLDAENALNQQLPSLMNGLYTVQLITQEKRFVGKFIKTN